MAVTAPQTGPDGITRLHIANLDLTATGTVPITSVLTGRKFIPLGAMLHVTTKSGTLTTGPIVRLGTNGTHDNVSPLLTVANTVVSDTAVNIPLVAALAAVGNGTAVSVEIQTAATGVTLVLAGSVHVWGLLV